MKRDEGRAVERGPGQFGVAGKHRAVGEAVEAVASDAVLHGQLVRDGVAIRVLGHRRVEGGVEDGDHGDVGAERRLGCPDAREARGVVERRQCLERFDRLQHVGVDQDGLREPLALRGPPGVRPRRPGAAVSVLGCRRPPPASRAPGGLRRRGLGPGSRSRVAELPSAWNTSVAPFPMRSTRPRARRRAPAAGAPGSLAKTWNLRDELPQLRARTITARTRTSATASGTSASMRASAREDPVTIGTRRVLSDGSRGRLLPPAHTGGGRELPGRLTGLLRPE